MKRSLLMSQLLSILFAVACYVDFAVHDHLHVFPGQAYQVSLLMVLTVLYAWLQIRSLEGGWVGTAGWSVLIWFSFGFYLLLLTGLFSDLSLSLNPEKYVAGILFIVVSFIHLIAVVASGVLSVVVKGVRSHRNPHAPSSDH